MKSVHFEKSLGIDIREESVALCLVGKSLRRLDVISSQLFEIKNLGPGASDETADNFVNQVTGFLKDFGGNPDRVVVCLPRSVTPVKTFALPAPDRQAVQSMIEFELDRHFATTRDQLHTSYHLEAEGDNTFRISAAGIQKDKAEYFLKLIESCGLKPAVLDASTFSNLNLLKPVKASMKGLEAILDLSSQCVEITILKDGVIQVSRNLPITDPNFKATYFRNDLPAEHFKSQSASVVKFLTEALQSTLYSCNQLEEDEGIERIYLIGGGDFAGPVAFQLEEETRVPTQECLPPQSLRKTLPIEFDPTTQNTALALAMRGLTPCSYQLNLLPTERLPAKKQSSLRTSLTLVVVTVLLVGAFLASKVAYNRMTLDSLNEQLKKVKLQVGNLEKVDQEYRTLSDFTERLNRADTHYPLKIDILKEMGRVLPKDTYVTRFTISKNNLEIQGFSKLASRLIGVVEESPMFSKTAFRGSVVNKPNGQKFTIETKISEEAS